MTKKTRLIRPKSFWPGPDRILPNLGRGFDSRLHLSLRLLLSIFGPLCPVRNEIEWAFFVRGTGDGRGHVGTVKDPNRIRPGIRRCGREEGETTFLRAIALDIGLVIGCVHCL
jgi:hypothetical protein